MFIFFVISHFSTRAGTLPPNNAQFSGVSNKYPKATLALLINNFVPGEILFTLRKVKGNNSKAWTKDSPSVKLNFNKRGAACESSLDFGADIFLIFCICSTILEVLSLDNSDDRMGLHISLISV